MDWLRKYGKGWIDRLSSCRYALLVILAGIFLLLLPSGGAGTEQPVQSREEVQDAFDLEAFEEKLGQTLSKIQGAGTVQVVLSLDSGSRRILAQDREQDGAGGGSSSTVTLGRGTDGQSVVPLQILAPEFRGALIVCAGGDDPGVKLELARAVSALTGLGADCISICKGDP